MTDEPRETLDMRISVFSLCAELINLGISFEAVLPILKIAAQERVRVNYDN